ncbi:MAG: hypothetical protein HZB47_04105 [Nitrosomonadales bacterium]|nr:hypothetical protein [Nitrosomonadales bacterium]
MDSHLIFNPSNKSASCIGALFFVGLLATPAMGKGTSSEPAALKAGIGVSAMQFKYEEFNDAGGTLDKEQGGIPGLSLKLGLRRASWELEGIASYHRGQVPYTGQTNLGVPYNTRTDETINDVSIRLGHWFGEGLPFMPFAGIGYRRWDRNILPNTLGGLFESYRWDYLWAGSKFRVLQRNSTQMMLDIGLLKPLHPEMHVDLRSVYNVEPVVEPVSKTGLRVMLTTDFSISEGTALTLEPYFEYWELGRSPTVFAGSVSVYEPASKTHNFGLNLRFAWTR